MFLIIILSFISLFFYVKSIKINYISDTTPYPDFIYLNEYVEDINTKLENKIEFNELVFTSSNFELFKTNFEAYNPSFVISNCKNLINDDLNNYLDENNVFIWCTDTDAIGSDDECEKSRIKGVSVIPSLEDSYLILSIKHSDNVAIILDDSEMADFYHLRLERLTSFYNSTIVYDCYNSTYSENDYINVLKDHPEGVSTILMLKDPNKYISLINAKADPALSPGDKFPILTLKGGFEYDELIKITTPTAYSINEDIGNMFVTSYNPNINNNITNIFNAIIDSETVNSKEYLSIGY